jgi:hypothetical protein
MRSSSIVLFTFISASAASAADCLRACDFNCGFSTSLISSSAETWKAINMTD